jgi:hypothetical protein
MAGVKKRRKKSPAIGRSHKTKSRHLKYRADTTVSQPQEEPAATVLPTPTTQILEDDEFVDEIEVATLDDALPPMKRVDDTVNKRLAIHYLFSTVFGTPTDRKTWYGQNGVQTSIRNSLHIPMNTSIIGVFEDILECHENGVAYDPSIKAGRGRPAKR